MIFDTRCASLKCEELPVSVGMFIGLVGEFIKNTGFHKFASCGRHFQDTMKAVFIYVTGRNESRH
jgi:hypothetical protein